VSCVRGAILAGMALMLLAPLAARAQSAEAARLDSIVASFVPRRFMGSVLVVRRDTVLLDRAYGFADRAIGRPNATTMRYPIGSLTKQFTAAAIMLLAERGRLHTSDSLGYWLPEAGPVWSPITIRELLSHTSGIPDLQDPGELGPPDTTVSPGERAVHAFAHRPLDFPPGTRYAYSNAGFLVLGRLIELASGMRYERFIASQVLEPLGLADTGFELERDASRRPRGYWARRDSVREAPGDQPGAWNAAGGLISTTHDLLRWQSALLGGQLLDAAALREMTTPVVGDYAYGLHHRTGSGREAYYHSGRTSGFESLLGEYPGDDLAIVVLENFDAGAVQDVFNALATAARR
jgi:CubicO group peptidase (beta-lactamase class C family)